MSAVPTISIVIPVFNREKLVLRCLDSIFAQTLRPLHIVVVDNNSSDLSLRNVCEWKDSHESDDFKITVASEATPGACAARNRGLREVTTEWVMFFDSDDEMNPDMAESVASAIADAECHGEHPEIVFWRAAIEMPGGTLRPKPFARRNLMRRHLINAILSTQTFAVRTEFIRECGGWNQSLPGWNDWELGARLLMHNPQAISIPRILARIHPQEISITGLNFNSRQGVWEKSIDTIEKECDALSLPRKEEIKRILNYRRVILAAHYAREGRPDLASNLLAGTLATSGYGHLRKTILKFIYHYTRLGGRAAYILWH